MKMSLYPLESNRFRDLDSVLNLYPAGYNTHRVLWGHVDKEFFVYVPIDAYVPYRGEYYPASSAKYIDLGLLPVTFNGLTQTNRWISYRIEQEDIVPPGFGVQRPFLYESPSAGGFTPASPVDPAVATAGVCLCAVFDSCGTKFATPVLTRLP